MEGTSSIQEIYTDLLSVLLPGRDSVLQVLLLAVVAGAVLSPLEFFFPAYPQKIFRRKGLIVDLCYWFVTPLATRIFTGIILGVALALLLFVFGFDTLTTAEMLGGFGPLSRQPMWLQCIEILLVADFIDYWTHRTLHRGRFWKIHAIHHSPQEMSWLSSSRVHPLNDLITRSAQVLPIAAFGFSAAAIFAVVPLIAFYVMFLHSNIRWDYGPALRWVLVSPAYHRWHHTSDKEGIDKNFAGIFPVWDLLFGTCHFPKRLPKKYGLRGQKVPESFLRQMSFPFVPSKRQGSTQSPPVHPG